MRGGRDEDLTAYLRPKGWGYSQVFLHLDLNQASTVSPKNIRSIRHTPKINLKLATPKNISILYLDLKKNEKKPRMFRNSPVLRWPPKISTVSSYLTPTHPTPQKIFIFLKKKPKIIEIQNVNA